MNAVVVESAVEFDCEGKRLVGVLHRRADQGAGESEHALVIVVGGGQYRVGAHRQFVFLARDMAAGGVPTLRFDVRGMGDSEGEVRHFLALGADLRAAVGAAEARVRPRAGTLLWGLCDGASAALLHAVDDARVRGVALVNPWISTNPGRARALLRHHYASRVRDPRFWAALVRGRIPLGDSFGSFASMVREARRGGDAAAAADEDVEIRLPDRMFAALGARDAGSTLVVVCERDLIAREFEDELKRRESSRRWWVRVPSVARRERSGPRIVRIDADHTFSERAGRERLSRETLDWVRSLSTDRDAQSRSSTGGS